MLAFTVLHIRGLYSGACLIECQENSPKVWFSEITDFWDGMHFLGELLHCRKNASYHSSSPNEQQLLCWIVLWHGVKYRMWAVRFWVSCGLVLKGSYWHFPYHYLVKAMCFKFHQWWLDWPGCHLRDLGCVCTVRALQGTQNVQWIRRIFPPPTNLEQ